MPLANSDPNPDHVPTPGFEALSQEPDPEGRYRGFDYYYAPSAQQAFEGANPAYWPWVLDPANAKYVTCSTHKDRTFALSTEAPNHPTMLRALNERLREQGHPGYTVDDLTVHMQAYSDDYRSEVPFTCIQLDILNGHLQDGNELVQLLALHGASGHSRLRVMLYTLVDHTDGSYIGHREHFTGTLNDYVRFIRH